MADKKPEKDMFDRLEVMDLYSRQIGAFGVETMKNLITLDVLILGLHGVGAEAAKDIILAGPRSVTLVDVSVVTAADLGSNCFFTTSSIGKRCAEVCVAPLSVLNPYVTVREHAGPVTADFVRRFGAVLATDGGSGGAYLRELGSLCREAGAVFLVGLATGVTATVFADFGPEHIVTDSDGEAAKVNVIKDISVEGDKVTITVADDSHELSDDQSVQFTDIDGDGVNVLNGFGSVPVHRLYITYDSGKRQKLVANKFGVALTEDQVRTLVAAGPKYEYRAGGVATEVKKRIPLKFRSLSEASANPLHDGSTLVSHPDASKMLAGRGNQLHFARLALWEFADRHAGAMPRLHDESDADECVAIARAALEAHRALPAGSALVVDAIDESVIRRSALYARAELSGLATFVGGVIAQEVVKRFGKFTPIRQFLHVDFFELVPEKGVPADSAPRGGRYDGQIAVIGRAAHERLVNQRWFMVGCGALGCEYLKGFALMGLGTGEKAVVHVTDMDRIEVSNLNRQFLFRRENVGQQKSVTAAHAAQVMNPEMKVKCFETKVCPETEDTFNDEFWTSLDGVCNALDNVIARRYVDSRCVFYERPLLESGTLGTKANSEIIIPHKTMSYSEQKDPEQGNAIPMCTLRNFPYLIDHAIEWGRAQFTEVFEGPARDAGQYLKNRAAFVAALEKEGNITAQLEKLEAVRSVLRVTASGKPTFDQCMQLAVNEFQKQYHSRIRDLTHSFPKDSRRKDPNTGAEILFWSGTKRFPQHTSLDLSVAAHVDYLFAASNLFAFMHSVPQVRDRAEFERQLRAARLRIPQWQAPKSGVNLFEEGAEKKEGDAAAVAPSSTAMKQEEEGEATKKAILEELEKIDVSKVKAPVAADFEKDDDTNFHIDFIAAASNMRAWNYHIKEASRHQVKMTAGRIIPAIATTTAMITGLVCMELYKLAQGLGKDKFYSSNVNLATSTFEFFEPENPKKAKKEYDVIEMSDIVPVPDGFTTWDKVVIDIGPDVTVQQFVDRFPSLHFGCTVNFLIKANLLPEEIKAGKDKPIFSVFSPTETITKIVAENKSKPLRVVYTELYGPPPPNRKFLMLDGSFATASGDVAKVPPIKFIFSH